jgi:hypothetical protein
MRAVQAGKRGSLPSVCQQSSCAGWANLPLRGKPKQYRFSEQGICGQIEPVFVLLRNASGDFSQGFRNASGASFVLFGLENPLQILALVAGGKGEKRLLDRRAFAEGGLQIGGNFYRFGRGLARTLHGTSFGFHADATD